jgi:multiple sugar transport system permease protein
MKANVVYKNQNLVAHIALSIGAFIMFFPFLWMIISSLKDLSQLYSVPPNWIPDPIMWGNYAASWNYMPFGTAYFNSFYITVIVVVVQLFTSSLAAYAFAKIHFPFRNAIFMLFLAMMMIPGQVTIIPLYLIMKEFGWLDSHLSLIVPPALFNAFGVFLLRQFIKGIPAEVEESAFLDGANRWTIYTRIVMPLVQPALSALGIFTFLQMWNRFFEPLIFLNSTSQFTVPLLLNQFRGQFITDWSLLMAGCAIAVIPVLIVYVLGQRYIIEGIAFTGLK